LDIEAAYRGIPCLPAHKAYLIVYHDSKLYIDHNIPFGLSSATGLQGEVADATIDIWRTLDIKPTSKWVNDVYIWCFPTPHGIYCSLANGQVHYYDYDLSSAKSLIAEAKVPWHKSKGQPFSNDGEYVGFFWSIPNKTVILIEQKQRKYILCLSIFISSFEHACVSLRELQRISGYLTHTTFIYPHGRSYLSNVYKEIASYPDEHVPHWLRKSTIANLKWWLELLLSNSTPIPLSPHPPTRDYGIWVDASTGTGIGILWNGHWAAWSTTPKWCGPSWDIAWLEAVAVELVVHLIYAKGITGTDVLIHSDNQGVIAAFQKGRSSNFQINLCIC
jgi:hypothetical protein